MNLVNALSRVSARERTMLAALVLVGTLIWLSALWRNWEAVSVSHRKVRHELARQAVWLADADRFQRELDDTLAQLDPARTYDASELIALIDEMARKGGLKHDLGTPVTVEQEVFLQHTLKVSIKNAQLAKLIAFERGIGTNHPYAAIEDFTITANKADPRLLNARMTVTAYQLASEVDEMEPWYD
ncbi:hypothetical protein PDESU_02819 [Pontiella desulfatans]|uniref:General secretion pathway protein M n=1 Tax=Pontiella desulfatans TaxID=2750659 RepID=A0A6C2U2Q2_PONDE|nr:hypothetical protein [Pontiella desulfatans]VGO14260.1 hypothetical protein PDESU_02819 [Pontiella desulfatans]